MSLERDIVRELQKQTKLLQSIADKLGVVRPEKKSVDLGNDLVVSIRKDHIEHTVTEEDSTLPRQLPAASIESPAGEIGSGQPFEENESGKPNGPLLTPEQLAAFKDFDPFARSKGRR